MASVGTLAGLILADILADILPSKNPLINNVMGMTLGNLLERAIVYFLQSNLSNWFQRWFSFNGYTLKIIYSNNKEAVFERFRNYIITKYVSEIQQCSVEPEDGGISLTLYHAKFMNIKVTDTFQDYTISLSFKEQSKSSNQEEEQKDVKEELPIILIESHTANMKVLHQYVKHICSSDQYKEHTRSKVLDMYSASHKIDRCGARVHCWNHVKSVSNKNIHNTIVSDQVQKELYDDIRWFVKNEDWYNAKGIPYKRGYLLYGPPGCGKTSCIKAIAGEYNLPIFYINLDIVNSDMGLANLMMSISNYVGTHRYIIVFEDVDRSSVFQYILKRNHNYSNMSISGLLNEIDGVIERHGCILFFTANDISTFTSDNFNTLFRPGRIDCRVKFDYCTLDHVYRIFQHFYNLTEDQVKSYLPEGFNFGKTMTPAELIKCMQNHPDDIEAVIRDINSCTDHTDTHVSKRKQKLEERFKKSRQIMEKKKQILKERKCKLKKANKEAKCLDRYQQSVDKAEEACQKAVEKYDQVKVKLREEEKKLKNAAKGEN